MEKMSRTHNLLKLGALTLGVALSSTTFTKLSAAQNHEVVVKANTKIAAVAAIKLTDVINGQINQALTVDNSFDSNPRVKRIVTLVVAVKAVFGTIFNFVQNVDYKKYVTVEGLDDFNVNTTKQAITDALITHLTTKLAYKQVAAQDQQPQKYSFTFNGLTVEMEANRPTMNTIMAAVESVATKLANACKLIHDYAISYRTARANKAAATFRGMSVFATNKGQKTLLEITTDQEVELDIMADLEATFNAYAELAKNLVTNGNGADQIKQTNSKNAGTCLTDIVNAIDNTAAANLDEQLA